MLAEAAIDMPAVLAYDEGAALEAWRRALVADLASEVDESTDASAAASGRTQDELAAAHAGADTAGVGGHPSSDFLDPGRGHSDRVEVDAGFVSYLTFLLPRSTNVVSL